MGKFAEYERYDAMGLAELVGTKKVSPTELFQEAADRIERLNPTVNAVVVRMDEQGRQTAAGELPQGPFTGVPFLIKDLLAAYAGVPTSYGNRVLKNIPAAHDSELVRRFKNSGVVILGKTNTPEFGLTGVTEPEVFGPCRNPWNPAHTPGGSSGGSGAAVAAGMVPMASAGDGGGSIRIPAACCGLFGIKPSRGRNPAGPGHGRIWQDAVQEHVISRSVRDSAAMLDATHGGDVGAPYIVRPPERPFLDEVLQEPGSLKIAFSTRSPIGPRFTTIAWPPRKTWPVSWKTWGITWKRPNPTSTAWPWPKATLSCISARWVRISVKWKMCWGARRALPMSSL